MTNRNKIAKYIWYRTCIDIEGSMHNKLCATRNDIFSNADIDVLIRENIGDPRCIYPRHYLSRFKEL